MPDLLPIAASAPTPLAGAPSASPAAGIAGLFAALVGDAAPAAGSVPTPDPLAGLLTSLQGQGQLPTLTITAQDLPAPTLAGLVDQGIAQPQPDGTITLHIQKLVAQLAQVINQLQSQGVDVSQLSDTAQLAAALEKLGLLPEEAADQANDISSILDLINDKLDLLAEDTSTPGDLLSLIAASTTHLTPVAHVPTQPLPIHHLVADASSDTPTAPSVRAHIPHITHAPSGADLARDVMGVGNSTPNIPGALAPDTVDTAVVIPSAELASTLTNLDSDLTNVPAPVAPVNGPQDRFVAPIPATPLQPSPLANQNTSTPIHSSDVIDKPSGVKVLNVSVDPNGQPVVDRQVDSLALRQIGEEVPERVQLSAGDASLKTTPEAGLQRSPELLRPPASFSDRLAQATRADVTNQTVVQVKNVIGQGGGVVRMILNPPELGKIHIEMTVADGHVTGQISATNNAVVELLARDVHSLKQAFADAGLKLGTEGLTLMLNNGNQQQQGQQGQDPRELANASGSSVLVSDDAEDNGLLPSPSLMGWVSPDQLVDVRI